MCGLLGVIGPIGRFSAARVERALLTMARRGPDDSSITRLEAPQGREVWLGHRRLSILDLSIAGRQPMEVGTAERRFVGVVNGEVYNYEELRKESLADEAFRSSSDSEVLLRGLQKLGPEFLKPCNGMFAFGSFDAARGELLLGRDRLGKKPLYVWQNAECLAFASSIAAFAELGLPLTLAPEGLAYYRWLGYIPGRLSIYREVQKFPAASFAKLDLRAESLATLVPQLYWDPFASLAQCPKISYPDAIERFLELLDDATRLRLRADVPVGAFLSGGVDSTLVLSSIARIGASQITAFTVKPEDPAMDESSVALESSRHFGIKASPLRLNAASFARQQRLVAEAFDEPFSDSSQIPTMAIAEAAREHVPVVLTGDGGDEVFLGYPWFAYPERMLDMVGWLRPFGAVRSGLAGFLNKPVALPMISQVARWAGLNTANVEVKRDIAQYLLTLPKPEDLYDVFLGCRLRSTLDPADRALIGAQSMFSAARSWYPQYSWDAVLERSMPELLAALDLVIFMRDDVLVKIDRATMFWSLEARSPMLDYRMVEFGLSLPLHYKMQDGKAKRILRDALAQRIPTGVASLPKRGFGAPLPIDLPEGGTPPARWNAFVEASWRQHYKHPARETG